MNLVEFLIEKNADINKQNECGATPLYFASAVCFDFFKNFVLKKDTNLSFICFLGKSFIGCQIFDCKRSRDRSSNGKWSFSFDAFESKNLVVLFFVSSFYFCVSVNNCQLIMNSKRKNIWKKLLSLGPRYTPVFDRVLA